MLVNKTAQKILYSICIVLGMLFVSVIPIFAEGNPIVINRNNQPSAKIVNVSKENQSNPIAAVVASTNLTFIVTPDANGNWTYSIPGGLDPGTYVVTVKDSSGKVLETSTFTVTSKTVKALPNTGILEDLMLPASIAAVLMVLGLGARQIIIKKD